MLIIKGSNAGGSSSGGFASGGNDAQSSWGSQGQIQSSNKKTQGFGSNASFGIPQQVILLIFDLYMKNDK